MYQIERLTDISIKKTMMRKKCECDEGENWKLKHGQTTIETKTKMEKFNIFS